MITRHDILSKAADDCMKELYSYAQPSVEWDDFVKQCKEYTKKYNEWKKIDESKRIQVNDYCGPRPYEFYYLPSDYMNEIIESYVDSYKIDSHQELLDTISILKNYCSKPVVDKYIDDYTDEYGNHHPGYRSYDHPDNLKKEVSKILNEKSVYLDGKIKETNSEDLAKELCEKFFEFLDMAGRFYNWNGNLNSFKTTIYLGCSPSSNKEKVIENWKKYKGIDVIINENLYKEDDEECYDSKESEK